MENEDPIIPDRHEDVFISNCGPLGSQTVAYWNGKKIASCKGKYDRLYVERAVEEWMEEQQFWPNVWFVDDHGGETLVTNLGE